MTTIAIAFSTALTESQKVAVTRIANDLGYGVSCSLAGAEKDVQKGIEQAAQTLGWKGYVFLHAPLPEEERVQEYDAALASRIQEELLQYEMSSREPTFFKFLMDFHLAVGASCTPYWVLFSGEWYADERVRVEEGTLSDLISRLKRPGNWQQRLLVVAVGRTQDSDEVPLLFKVHGEAPTGGKAL